MKKLVKILLIFLLIVAIIIGGFAIFISANGIPTYQTNFPTYAVNSDSTKIVRGKKLASMLCANCHKNEETGALSGRVMNDAPEFGFLYAQNITQDDEFGIGTWTDAELLYLLRTGVKRDGKYAPPYMAKLPLMADEDLEAIIAFLRSDDELVKPVHVADKPCEPSFLTKFLCQVAFKPLPMPEQKIELPDTTNQKEWGRYLTINLDCWTCHSPSFEKLNVLEPEKTPGFLSGGNPALLNKDGHQVLSLNITSDAETGLGNWSESQFVNAVKYGIVQNDEALRFPMVPYTRLTDYEAKAIFAYLKSVPVISNKVERSIVPE